MNIFESMFYVWIFLYIQYIYHIIALISLAKEPVYQHLQDPATPSGRLIDRINRMRQKCIEGLGKEVFLEAYRVLQDYEEVIVYVYIYFLGSHLLLIVFHIYSLYTSIFYV